ncbi:glycosyltransferase family 4 protein [Cytobacillus oceanisediminis]|uniref:glycosyltransferase family 4 protein n=1 Tax=Cytobacillus oceanisediminis TaxID=665099 RepID=UPI0037357A4F
MVKIKKVLIIHHSGNIGGAGISCYNTALSLSKRFEVIVYCPSTPKLYSEFLKSKQIKVKTFDFPLGSIPYYSGGVSILSPVFIKNLLNIKRYKMRWEEIIVKESPDLVIVNSKTTSWFSLLTNKLMIKSICFVRETRKNAIFNVWNGIQAYLLNKFSGVVFISNYDRKREKLKSPITAVVPNYLDISMYNQKKSRDELCEDYGISPSSFNILFVGGMARIKGIDVAINSMKYLRSENVNLIIAGDSKFRYKEQKSVYIKIYNFLKQRYEKKIIRTIEKYNLNKKIIKVGIQKDMADMYSLADVLIFPANEPHQARPAFEVGVQKKPVIMPDFNNTDEYVKNGHNGLIFKRRNPRSLADSIKKLINDPVLKIKLGRNNYKQTLDSHTREHSEKLLQEAIDEILNTSSELK